MNPEPPLSDDQRTMIEQRGPQLPPTQADGGLFAPGDEPFFPGPLPLPLARLADYEILNEIGRGGMGVVYKARHVTLNRVVALKMILGGTLARPEDLGRFETEVKAAAQLQHPGIVGLFEVGSYENQPYFSMEFVSGTSLAQKAATGPLSGRRAAKYMEAVARAVHFAHDHGILHRDLKPANVLLDDANDQPKVTDFGLAKLMSTDSGQTRTGAVLGTPSYMSPEQGQGRRDVGPASDVYSLGAVLYELITGGPPFRGETALATLTQVAEKDPVPPRLLNPAVDRDLETITLKCLEKDPGRRYASAEDLADDLRRFLGGEPITARRLSVLGRAVKWCRRKPALAALVFVTITALVGFLVFEWLVALEESELRVQAQTAERKARVREEAMRHLLYLAEVRRAQQALESADLDQAKRLLQHWAPRGDGLTDLRDWEWHFLRERMQGRFTLDAHAGRASAVAYSPDGKRLASAGGEPTRPGEIKIWDTATGKLVATLKGHADSVTSLHYHPRGHLLASGSFDKTVKIWDLERNQELVTLRGHTKHVAGVAFSAQEPILVSGGGDRNVRLWNYEAIAKGDKSAVKVLPGHLKEVSGVAVSPAGDVAASAGLDGLVLLWDIKSGALRDTLKGHEGDVLCVAFSPSGKILASGGGKGSMRGEVKFWETDTGQLRFARYGLSDRILGLAFSKDGKLAAAGRDGVVRIWDQAISSEALRFRGDPHQVSAVAFSPDGQHVSWAGRSGRVNIALSSGGLEALNLANYPVEALAFGPAGRFLACAGGSSKDTRPIQVWNLDRPDEPILFKGHVGGIMALAFSPDGRHLAAAGEDRVVRIHDLRNSDKPPLSLIGHGGRIGALAYRADGTLLASASDDETIRLWNPVDGKSERVLTGHKNDVLTVAFSPDGRWLASGAFNKTLRVWDLRDFTSMELKGHTGAVNAVAFSPNSQQLASAGGDRTVRIWDVDKDTEFMKLEGSPSPVVGLAYHKGGRRLVTACQDKMIRIWDVVTHQEILELEEPSGNVRAVAFSRDGRYLAAATSRGVRVWDAGDHYKGN
jgi:WD40 repeat protein